MSLLLSEQYTSSSNSSPPPTIRPTAHSELTRCSRCKQQETENSSVCSWMKQSNARISSRSAADLKHGVRQQRKPCHLSCSYSTNAVTTRKECQRRASTGWQCNQERARRTSCAQAGTAFTVFSLWLATKYTSTCSTFQLKLHISVLFFCLFLITELCLVKIRPNKLW